jgi:hypothetical protein
MITLLNISKYLKHWGELPHIVLLYSILKVVQGLSVGIGWISLIVWRIAVLERQPYLIVQRLSWIQVLIVLSIMTWSIVRWLQ